MHEELLKGVSQQMSYAKELFLEKCSEKVFPPLLFRAFKKNICISLVQKFIKQHDIHVKVERAADKQVFMCDGKPVGEFFILWKIPIEVKYIIF